MWVDLELIGDVLRWEGALGLQRVGEGQPALPPAYGFGGLAAAEPERDGIVPWRVRLEDLALVHEGLRSAASAPSGVRLVWATDSRRVRLECSNAREEPVMIDLVVDGRRVRTETLATPPGPYTFEWELPDGETAGRRGEGLRRVEVWLPNAGRTVIHRVAVEAGAQVAAVEDERPRWVTYGSSITQCARAASPTRAWPAIVAETHGWHLTSLGYAGQCKFDPIAARTVAGLKADVISLCLGINTYAGEFSPRTWLPAVEGVLWTVRQGHPNVPLVVISPIYSGPRETQPGPTGLTLEAMRAWLVGLVDTLRARGDEQIIYLDGREIIGEADAACMPDNLHPDAAGIELMGERIARLMAERLAELGADGLLLRPQPTA